MAYVRRYELKSRGYAFDPTSSATRLEKRVRRARCGLISYENRAPEELARFCQQRKFCLPHDSQINSKADLIAILEHADDDATFEQFGDLPAELRVRVYEILFRDQCSSKARPSLIQPPITNACRLVRKEALPIFYDTIRVAVGNHVVRHLGPHDTGVRTSIYLRKVPEAVISRLKKLSLNLMIDKGRHEPLSRWEIDIAGEGKTRLQCVEQDFVTATAEQNEIERKWALRLKPHVESGLRKVLEQVTARDEEFKLLKKDIMKLLRALADAENAWREER